MSRSESRIKKKAYPIRLSDEDHARIKAKADAVGASFGGYVRDCALEKRIVAGAGERQQYLARQQHINECRRLGGLLKHIFTESGGYGGQLDPAAFAACLADLRLAIRRIEQAP